MLDLMRGVVDGRSRVSTGTGYYVKGYDLAGKTGTAEIASGGKYLASTYVRSFAGVFPANDPQVIIYVAVSKIDDQDRIKKAVKNLVRNIGTYLNIKEQKTAKETKVSTIENYSNKQVKDVEASIKANKLTPIILGDGLKVINQYPKEGIKLNVSNKVFLLTASNEYKMLEIKGWSRSDVETYAKLLNIKVTFDGYGYVKKYSIKKDTVIHSDDILSVTLEPKYKKE